jgi:hypothetical protein
MNIHTYTCIYIYVHICIYTCINIYVYIFLHIEEIVAAEKLGETARKNAQTHRRKRGGGGGEGMYAICTYIISMYISMY